MIKFFSVINLLFAFVLIALGAFAKNDLLSLECVTWPLCYASKGELLFSSYPMVHRLLAGLVLLVHGAIWIKLKNRSDDQKFLLNLGAVLLIVQSLLGALSSVYKFPTIMNSVHLLLSVGYFVTFFRFTFSQFTEESLNNYGVRFSANHKDFLAFIVILCFFQLVIGSILNHSSARNICGGIENLFLCQGSSAWPSMISAKIHMLHRFLGVFIFFLIIIYFIASLRTIREYAKVGNSRYVALSAALFFITIFHFFYSKYLFIYFDRAWPVVAHLTFALLLIGLSFILLDYKRSLEIASFGNLRHTTLSDMLELTKPRLGLLVVATMFTGVLISARLIDFFSLSLALLLSTLVVASATTLNCLLELKVDSQMDRTKDRALPSGRLSPKIAFVQGVVLALISLPGLYLIVNWQTALLGFIAWASYLFAYTPMKRVSPAALYIGALPGAIPPVMGRTIVMGEFDLISIFLFIILFIWQVPHFLAISIYHREDYRSGGIKVYSHYYSNKKLSVVIFVTTVLLAVSAVLPSMFGLANKGYLYLNIFFAISFIGLSILGFKKMDELEYARWAKKYFWGSIIYLPLVMLTFIFFM